MLQSWSQIASHFVSTNGCNDCKLATLPVPLSTVLKWPVSDMNDATICGLWYARKIDSSDYVDAV